MAESDKLRLVVVTPESTLLDEPVEALRFPLFDGQIGILPGRAPLVGRLGYGELRITTAAGTQVFYIDGGFVQVKGAVVSLLTNRALKPAQIDVKAVEAQLAAAIAEHAATDVEQAARETRQIRARQMLAVAGHGGSADRHH